MRKSMELETTEQIRALAHPMRQRILHLLQEEAKTNKQVASELGEPPSRVHFHVRELEKNGLIELVDQQLKGGIMEKYYRAAAMNLYLGPKVGALEVFDHGLADSTLQTAREGLASAFSQSGEGPPNLQVVQEQVRLSPERLERINDHLEAINQEFQEAQSNPDKNQYGEYMLTYIFHGLPDSRDDEK